MDGNGRWARRQGLPSALGHQRGAEAVRHAIKAAITAGVPYLTLFGFSSENWSRPAEEVEALLSLLRRYLKSETVELQTQGIQLKVIGERHRFPADIVAMIEQAEQLTRDNSKLHLTLALNYGGRAEIAAACRRIARLVAEGELRAAAVNETHVAAHLDTAGMPDPDLIIRTSGEQRLSNFLLWQAAYAEFVFLDILWPEFNAEHFTQALEAFHGRERRYGARAS